MRLLLINPPHPAIGSRIPREHLPPLGLLALGGPLLDAGHTVRLLDAEFGPIPPEEIAARANDFGPDAVLIGHSGSTSGHPSAMDVARVVRWVSPSSWIIYGGVLPTFHWSDILSREGQVDFVVRGEGEEAIVELIAALQNRSHLDRVAGLAYREGVSAGPRRQHATVGGTVRATPARMPIACLDKHRIGWELIDHRRYTYWGQRRAVVAQFSRGCPHRCNYCGQRVFWRGWRHRDPVKFAAELAWLHREKGVEVINFADENPTADPGAWQAFLEALIAENTRLILVGSTRAGDIVRDAGILHLYKKAGVARFLLGIESTDEATLQRIRKGSTEATDREAIRLLRQHGIISMAAWVTGFAQETDRDYWRTLRQILAYDPDQIQSLYATPHWWTAFGRQESVRRIVQPNLRLWDYKHQVLESENVPNWRVLLWMKFIEAVAQLRPVSLWRMWFHPDAGFRAAMRWYYRIGRRVWPYELWHWLFTDRRTVSHLSVGDFWSAAALERDARVPTRPALPAVRAREIPPPPLTAVAEKGVA